MNTIGIFFSTGFVPREQYPQWIQPVVAHQPMSYAIEAMRGLSLGGPIRGADAGNLLMGRRHYRGMRCADGYRLPKREHAVMFPASEIRKLAPSEEMFAQSQTFFGSTAQLNGPVDIDAMSVAFDTLLQAHPVLGGHLERGPDGAASHRCRRPSPPGHLGGAT